MDLIKAPLQWIFLFLSNVVFILAGFIMVAIAIPFRVDGVSVSDGRWITNLPRWAWVWGNDFDGLLGDKRMWYAANTPWGLPTTSFISMYNWAALRNPADNMRRMSLYSAPVTDSVYTYKGQYDVGDKPGMGGWQFVKAVSTKGKSYYGFYLVHEWNDKAAFVIRLGYKLSPDQAGTVDQPKGFTTKINLYKSI